MASFNPTPEELSLVNKVFAVADPQKIGIVTGDAAVKVLSGAKLSPSILGEVWAIADSENNGFLSKKGVAIALRLIGWAQKGERVTQALVNKPGPPAVIDGISAVTQHSTGLSGPPKSPPPMPGIPPFTPQDKAKFLRMFQSSGPVNGFLSGEKARDIFVKSKLPVDKLSQIWNLADTQDRGYLDATDFAIGMYFIQAAMSNQLPFIPTSLPPGLYEQAGGSASTITTHTTGTPLAPQLTGGLPHRSPLQPQYTGQAQPRVPRLPSRPTPSSVIGAAAFGSAFSTPASLPWDVTATEKANADRLFDGLDTLKRGYIEGEVAVPFMLESKLPGDVLAQVWDLADIHNDGKLTRDGFAIAMHLIQGKLSGKDIPAALPPTLVPPSMRALGGTPTSSAFAPPKAPEPQIDLLGDDSPPSAPVSLPQISSPAVSHTTGSRPSTTSPFPTHTTGNRDPFGSFNAPAPAHVAPAHDFFGDDHEPAVLHEKSAEIGNVQNQLNSTNRSLETAKTDRASLETQIANQAAQLSALQTQLSSAKAAYETETKLLSNLRERYNSQQAEMQKTREELIRAESDLSAVRVEKAEVEGTFLRDKEEARELHRRMVETGQQAEALKVEAEKVKKEAKQQKGRLAIARKQLSTKEAEKVKAEHELAEANDDLAATNKEVDDVEAELAKEDTPVLATSPINPLVQQPEHAVSSDSLTFAASHALPLSPDVTGTSSISKSNNPFERLAMGGANASSPLGSSSPFLPFANASVPSPSVPEPAPKVESNDDPFGFSQAFGEEITAPPTADSASKSSEASAASTPKQHNLPDIVIPPPVSEPAPVSPSGKSEVDTFATPPTTATGPSPPASPPPATITSEPFKPEAPEAKEHDPPSQPRRESVNVETDLTSSLKELDVDESDSSDDDDVPLATLSRGKEPEKPAEPATNGLPEPKTSFSFEDAFGSAAPPASSQPTANATDAFGMPVSAKPAGASEFDEALGKLPSGNAAPAAEAPISFSFDTGFEDSFDFDSNKFSTSAPAAAPSATVQPTSTSVDFPLPGTSLPPIAPVQKESNDFDAIFAPLSSQTNGSAITPEPPKSATFDDIFASTAASPTPNGSAQKSSFDDVFGSKESAPKPTNPIEENAAKPPGPSSPKEATSPGSLSQAIARSMSPPPRQHSPTPTSPVGKSRISTSSKESTEKPPPAKHSKLSILRPFSRKKKEAPPPPPSRSQVLTPPAEGVTPAVEDDIEPVKQLCGMGFSRTQAVAALEANNYDMQKALNSLLGQ